MKNFHNFPVRVGRAFLACSLGVSMAFSMGLPAQAAGDPDLYGGSSETQESAVTPAMQEAEGTVSAYIQFKGAGAFETTQPLSVRNGNQDPVQAIQAVKNIQSEVEGKAESAAEEVNGDILYTTHNAMRGVALEADAAALRELAERSDVEKISLIVAKERYNGATDADTQTLASWVGLDKTGSGVKIAVIDSGIDYTHADFGGPGTQEAYDQASASLDMPAEDLGLYDSAKFIGGYDLVGDDYSAGVPGRNVPKPDGNPLDCREGGHGTHVAGTAAGYGVDSEGNTFRGDYTTLTEAEVRGMKIGPGSAPEAELIGLRVFGCSGSTTVTGEALDRALDPNGDGDFSDRANIVNLSLGSDFGPVDDPENDLIDALARQGTLSVIAAGNANGYNGVGDTYSNLGNPANTVSGLAVANSIGSTYYVDLAEITAPENIKGRVSGDYSRSYDYSSASEADLRGTVVAAAEENKYACEAFPAGTDFAGQWVLIDWYDSDDTFPCGSKVRFDHIQQAGGAGVVLTSRHHFEETGIAGNTEIPGVRLNVDDSAKVRQATANGGSFDITLRADWIEAEPKSSNALDTLNSSSARGQHGSEGFTKPDVAAPGTNIMSAGVGEGNGGEVMTGTSMSTPHVAGIAALVLEAHQNYSPAEIKAAIMNTATHDLKTDDGVVYAVDRVGAGRVDAKAAIETKVLVYNSDNKSEVSQSFEVVEVTPGDPQLVLTRKFTVDNFDSVAHTYAVSYDSSVSMPGVSISVTPGVTVEAGGTQELTVTATIDPSKLEKTADPALQKTQLDIARQYIAQESGRIKLLENGKELRVPVQIAPKPVANMSASIDDTARLRSVGSAEVTLSGVELNQGGYRGLLGAFELGARSDRQVTSSLPRASAQQADLQYVGAHSNAPALAAEGKSISEATLSFGISTWSNWSVITRVNAFEVSIDTDGNLRPDYFLVTDRIRGLDLPIATLYGYVNGNLRALAQYPVNGTTGDVDTNLMDSNTMVLPVELSALNITESNADQVSYRVDTYSWDINGANDSTGWIQYNPISPDLWFSADKTVADILYEDLASTKLVAHRGSGQEKDALFLHLHNGTGDLSGTRQGEDGGRAEVVELSSSGTPAPSEDPTVPIYNPRFTDVPEDYVFYKEIAWLASKGITRGWSDGTFRPTASVERGQMAAFFYRLAGSPQYTPPTESPFRDVPTDHVFYKEISWMHSVGIARGWSDGTFRPTASVERGQMAAFFYRFAGEPSYTAPASSRFRDISTDNVFYREISWLADKGITTGWDDGTYRDRLSIQRDQMAAFIYRYAHSVQ